MWLLLAAMLTACGSDPLDPWPSQAAGTFELLTVDEHDVPWETAGINGYSMRYHGETLVLEADGRFTWDRRRTEVYRDWSRWWWESTSRSYTTAGTWLHHGRDGLRLVHDSGNVHDGWLRDSGHIVIQDAGRSFAFRRRDP